MNDPFLLSKTVIKGTHSVVWLGGQPAGSNQQLFIITKAGSGVQGELCFSASVFLAQWGQNCGAKGDPWKPTSWVCHKWLLHALLMTSRQCFLVTMRGGAGHVPLQTLPIVPPCGSFAGDPELQFLLLAGLLIWALTQVWASLQAWGNHLSPPDPPRTIFPRTVTQLRTRVKEGDWK